MNAFLATKIMKRVEIHHQTFISANHPATSSLALNPLYCARETFSLI